MSFYACSVCGSREVQHAMWVSLNTNEVHDEFGTWNYEGSTFCPDCEDDSHPPIDIWDEWDDLEKADRQAVTAFQMLKGDNTDPSEFGWYLEYRPDPKMTYVKKGPKVSA